MILANTLWEIKEQAKNQAPLVHCITNPISINGCANMILALGAKAIMAEHPKEVEAITQNSHALVVNLGNITDSRLKAIYLSGLSGVRHQIPRLIDLVGVGVSPLRLDFGKKYIKDCKPHIIKGNMSEIKAILGLPTSPIGIDVGEGDQVECHNLRESVQIACQLARQSGATVLISGKLDIISNGKDSYLVRNGVDLLSAVTGTGCMLGAIIGALMPGADPLYAALAGTLILTIAGELSANAKGTGSFMGELLDHVSSMTKEDFHTIANYVHYKE